MDHTVSFSWISKWNRSLLRITCSRCPGVAIDHAFVEGDTTPTHVIDDIRFAFRYHPKAGTLINDFKKIYTAGPLPN